MWSALNVILGQLSLLCLTVSYCACSVREERYWPLNVTTRDVPLPQSSPFGPRLQISQNNRYDFHRGVDIPAELFSTVYAIDDGFVRIPGPHHDAFTDGVVQLRHVGWEDDGDPNMNYYSTYIHMNESFIGHLNIGDPVAKGTPIGTSYLTNNFPHLHFEIRVGTLFQSHACNPWRYLPCNRCSPFRANLTVSLNSINGSSNNCSAIVKVSLPPDQLTFDSLLVEVSGGTFDFNRTIDLCEINMMYTGDDASALDNNMLVPDLIIDPQLFNSRSFSRGEWSTLHYTLLNIPGVSAGNTAELKTIVFDVFGEKVATDPIFYDGSCSQVDPPTTTVPDDVTTAPVTSSARSTCQFRWCSLFSMTLHLVAIIYTVIAVL